MSSKLAKVLCVDDEEGILEALERTLRKRFEVFTAASPEEGKAIFESEEDIAIVVSDYIMGPKNGVEFLSQIKKINPNTSRVLLSGQIEIKSMEEAINKAKIHKFIMKPWDNEHLLIQVVEAYKHHKLLVEKEKLKALSITDPITQLTNHRFFQEKLRIEWDKHTKNKDQLSLIIADIDHFKRYNDRFGHPEGDKVLAQVAEKLRNSLPENASISRYGGEEFTIILSQTNSQAAHKVAEALRLVIASESFGNYPLSISLGVATSPEHASSVNELIISADQSLYQAKRRGRNQTIVGLPFDD